jgi:putative ABC transport system permease protein
MNLLLRCGLRHHARHPLQSLLTLLGIAAGTALLVAMQSAQRTAERAFDQAVATVAGAATHTVTAGPNGIPVAAYAALCRELGGRPLAPSVHAIARTEVRAQRTVLRVLGVDPLADTQLRPWAAAGQRDAAPVPVGELMVTAGAFLATPALLARLSVAVGEALPITVGGRPFVARALAALDVPPAVAAGLDDVLLVDIATAQAWTGRDDRIDRLDLRLDGDPDGGPDEAAALAAVRAQLGPGARIEAVGTRQGGLGQLARGFRINLTALSLLSLLVGAFLVHETMRLSVVARRPSFGVLRALGVSGRALGRVVAGEALALGLLGSGLGAALGVAAADLLLVPLVRTLNDHYATFSLQQVAFDPWLVLACVLLGGGVAMLAGLGPALAAARVTARSVLVQAASAGAASPSPWRALRRALPLLAVAAWLLATVGDRLVQGYLGVLALVLAAVVLVSPAMGAVLATVAKTVARSGPFVRYVVRSTAAARDHLALPVAAMVLALATTIGMATLVASFRDSVAGWLGEVLPGDVFVAVPGGIDERTQPFVPAVATALATTPGIAAATRYHRTVLPVHLGGRGTQDLDVVGIAPTPAWERSFPLLAGDAAARAALSRGDGAFVSEPLAFRFGLQPGQDLVLGTERGPVALPIAAIYRDYSKERGEVLVGASWLEAHAPSPITAYGFEVAAGNDVAATVAALRQRAAAAGDQAVEVRAQRELRASSLQVFDRTFAITGVMRLLCLAVAFVGIYAAFAALQLERGREVGLLRCLGARPGQIALVVLGQTALLGGCAGLLALPLGAVLGHVLAHVINRVSFGWSLATVAMPPAAAVEAVGLAVGAAVLAGLQPAWRFARMRPAQALREA